MVINMSDDALTSIGMASVTRARASLMLTPVARLSFDACDPCAVAAALLARFVRLQIRPPEHCIRYNGPH